MISVLNFVTLLMLFSAQRALRAFNPASPVFFAATQNRSACTLVFWPDSKGSLLCPPATLPTKIEAMGSPKPSTWLSHLWMLSKTLATPGISGVADGRRRMLSTSSCQVQLIVQLLEDAPAPTP